MMITKYRGRRGLDKDPVSQTTAVIKKVIPHIFRDNFQRVPSWLRHR